MAAQISTAFVTSPVTQVDAMIDKALGDIGNLFDVDRAYIFLYNISAGVITCTNEWHAKGVDSIKSLTLPISIAPFWSSQISRHIPVIISNPDDIPIDAYEEQILWARKNVKSFMGIPMSQEDHVLGFIGIDTINREISWPEEMVNQIALLEIGRAHV